MTEQHASAADRADLHVVVENDDDQIDGRTLRRQRNRDAVIDALISLIREGDLDPTVAKIADRAEVSHRSVFRYFDDLDDLGRTAIETEFRKTLPMGVIPDVGQGDLDHRISQLLKSTLNVLERTHALSRVARARTVAIPEVDRGLAMVADVRRDQVSRHFATELDLLERPMRDAITHACMSLLSFESYDSLSRHRELTRDEINSMWTMSLKKLLA